MQKFILILMLGLMALTSIAPASAAANLQSQPIKADKAFKFSASSKDANSIIANFDIAPGYFLYKDRFSYKLVQPEGAELGSVEMPTGIMKTDDILGDHEVYRGNLALEIPLENMQGDKATIRVCYQGCSQDNYCYPPQTKQVTIDLNAPAGTVFKATEVQPVSMDSAAPQSKQDKITALLSKQSLSIVLLSFFGFGLLLTFTPCVLPMIPILSGIIIGHGKHISTGKAFTLSLIYVLAMALTYAVAGVAAGFAGNTIQAALQTPWIIGAFSVIFVLLALSLFGFYEIRLPSRFESDLSLLSQKQKSGSYFGVAAMGVLSTLIVSPCVSAPLIGALAYIGNTGNAVLGGFALFVMGLGMGLPLLLIGTSSGKLLPKSGPWMESVKAVFGVMMLALAIWMLSRILPGQIILFLWAALLLISSVYLGVLNFATDKTGWHKLWQGLGLLLATYGILLMIGASQGNTRPLQPLGRSVSTSIAATTGAALEAPLFKPIKSNDDFDLALAQAAKLNKPVLLDFYADWCIACKEMEYNTFSDPEVRQLMKNFIVLQADVTANDMTDKALEERLRVIAPPSILFFDREGTEMKDQRIVGEMDVDEFKQQLQNVLNNL